MSEFVEYLHEVFERFGPIRTRKMFGGYGVYHNGLMFGLVANDTLYLKADAENARFFEKEGLEQFGYNKNGRAIKMSYYEAPDGIMDDREQAAIWARRSFEAALRSQAPGKKSRRR
jgi:DNA transformation protein and related proteins